MTEGRQHDRGTDPFKVDSHIDPNVDSDLDQQIFSPPQPALPKRDPNAPLTGDDLLLERYRIIKQIGRGGMGFVYQAQEIGLERYVAIKVFPPQFAMDENLVQRFQAEVRIASSLDHPNIVPIYFVGQDEGLTFFVMKFLAGRTLSQRVREKGPLPADAVINVAVQTLGALDFAHSRGTIHRDIKPGNIMLGNDGLVSLMDFGIARSIEFSSVTRPGEIVGTAEYMSPEQWSGNVDHRSDLYSFGVVLYECLTGRPPFHDQPIPVLMKAHLDQDPPLISKKREGLPGKLDAAVMRLLQKNPQDRFSTAREAQEAFYALSDTLPRNMPSAAGQLSVTHSARASMAATLNGDPETVPMELPTSLKKMEKLTSLMDRAELFYNDGKLKRAVKLLEGARKINPGDATLLHRLDTYQSVDRLVNGLLSRAQKLIDQGQLARAESELEKVLQCYRVPQAIEKKKAVRARRQSADQMFQLAQRAERAGRIRRARRRYKKVLSISPDRTDAEFRLKLIAKTRKRRRGATLHKFAPYIAVLALIALSVGGYLFLRDPTAVLMPRAERCFASQHWVSPPLYNSASLYRLVKFFDIDNVDAEKKLQMMEDSFRREAVAAERRKDYQGMLRAYQNALRVDPDDLELQQGLEQARNAIQIDKSFE
ncbi:MAG: serine/threonine-protein kinase [Candidatus Alcyoniella australis]|nr:serine/threonine-protein kinase [Candidatus Alcyoniella australis]